MLNIGQILQGRYHIIKELGRGGFGAVYEAVEIELKTTCVIKQMLPPDDPALAIILSDQFLREAQTLATLRHSNLPRVTHHFVEEGNYYLVMDFVAGKSMEKLIGDAGLAEDVVLGYADQLLGVLEYIHAKGIIHRDIKPANIIVQPDGKVMLVDFGLVKNTVAGGTSMHALSAYYAPPEQYTGGTDQCSDLFSLAATLYQALTGKLPATATDRSAGAPLIPIPQYRAGISDRTVRVITKALTLNRIGRYRTAAEMRSELMNVNGKHGISVNVRAIASVGMIFALIAIACVVVYLLVNIPPPVATTVPLPTMTISTIATPVSPTASSVPPTSTPVSPTPTYKPPSATPIPASTPTDPAPTATVTPNPPTPIPTIATTTPTVKPTSTTQNCAAPASVFAAVWGNIKASIGCPTTQAVNGQVVIETFERGLMLWRQPLDTGTPTMGYALVLLNNGAWQRYSHTPYTGNGGASCAQANNGLPKGGFGMMWCDIEAIRTALGNATSDEINFSGGNVMMDFEHGSVVYTADKAVYVLYSDGTWSRQ